MEVSKHKWSDLSAKNAVSLFELRKTKSREEALEKKHLRQLVVEAYYPSARSSRCHI